MRAPRGSAGSAPGAPRTRAPPARRARRGRRRPSARGWCRLPSLSSLGLRLREQLTKAAEAGEHPALDRTQGLSEPFRELGLREPAVVGELDRLTLLVRQARERRLHPLALVAKRDDLVARDVGRVLALVERLRPPPFLAPHEVDRTPVHEGQK